MSIQDILLSDSYRLRDDLSSEEDWINLEALFNANGIPYPSRAELPEDPQLTIIRYSSDREVFFVEGLDREDADLAKLSDTLEAEGHSVYFHRSIKRAKNADVFGGMAEFGSRMLIGTVEHRRLAISHYWGFLDGARAYIKNPDSLVLAYDFLTYHPAFWYKRTSTGEWITDYSPTCNYTVVLPSDKGGHNIMIESGANVPGTEHHYHDLRLDVFEPTFEQAYISLARNVHRNFDLDGTDYGLDLSEKYK